MSKSYNSPTSTQQTTRGTQPAVTQSGSTYTQTAVTPCEDVKCRIEDLTNHMNGAKAKYNSLLGDYSDENLLKLEKLGEVIDRLQADLQNLRVEQRRLGCLNQETPQVAYDNQTVLSTSAVRRKDSRALADLMPPPPVTPSTNTNQY